MILDERPSDSFKIFLKRCSDIPDIDVNIVMNNCIKSMNYYKANKILRGKLKDKQYLETKWYMALKNGEQDYSIYGGDDYLGDIWACWVIYSRSYLRAINNIKSLGNHSVVQDMGNISLVADLGCGFGYTTAGLKQLFPMARVVGTNLPNTKQVIFAEKLSKKYRFEITYDLKKIGNTDLVFASEYFEHFYEPIKHLQEVLKYLNPEFLLIANAFGADSIGHFPQYKVNNELVSNKDIGRQFNQILKDSGYKKTKTKLWNNRPNYWKKI